MAPLDPRYYTQVGFNFYLCSSVNYSSLLLSFVKPKGKYLHAYDANVECELHPQADGEDDDDCRNGAEVNVQHCHHRKELHDDGSDHHDDDGGQPRIDKDGGDGHEDHAENRGQRHAEPEPQPDVLLPEGEGDAGGKVGQASVLELAADPANLQGRIFFAMKLSVQLSHEIRLLAN